MRNPAGQATATVPGVYLSGFNEDGSYWLSRGTRPDQLVSSDLIGLADQPSGPRYHVVPEGSELSDFVTLADGQVLAGSTTNVDDFRNNDYLLVDPRSGASSALGLRGFLSVAGKTRVLGIFAYAFERGDLTAVDFTSGRRTVVAAECAMAALAEPQGDDQFAPGARVVYQFRARYQSPYSGLWLTTVP